MMTLWPGYIAAEDVALTAPQRAAIVAAFKTLGPANDPQPARLNHWRVSLDGSKVIFEAAFKESALTVASVKQFLADAVGVDPGVIDHEITQTARGPLVVYSVAGTDRMRFLAFAGIGSTWDESRQQVLLYLANNPEEWETEP